MRCIRENGVILTERSDGRIYANEILRCASGFAQDDTEDDMAKDFYQVLGVPKSASADEIKKAYRQLARQHHPDVNKGNKTSENRFKEISEAYDTLSDLKKKQQYDAFGGAGAQWGGFPGGGRPSGGQQYTWTSGGGQGGDPFGGADQLGDIFSEIFGMGGVKQTRGHGRSRQQHTADVKGQDLRGSVEIEFLDALHGTSCQFELRKGRSTEKIAVKVPAGVTQAQQLRVSGKGEPSPYGGPAGDLFLTVQIKPHPHFWREEADIFTEFPITFYESILGGEVEVTTPDGIAKMKIPSGTSSGQKFRLKGKGAPKLGKNTERGDLYAVIQIVPPKKITKHLKDLAKTMADEDSYDPRAAQ